ncbi:phospholipase D-like domain-containing protein [Flexivirga alba]|uniref:Phosphatidylserine/phosphatidylglycerophosphate/ cardiolipin synthase family protein n=1 Tax=Flexivirga alba TaxID=702742 RepID=A0ABW2ACL6_9MICO
MTSRQSPLDFLDNKLGGGVEAAIAAEHRFRLRRHGHAALLRPPAPGTPAGWVDGVPVRRGNRMEVLVDGEAALRRMQEAIEGARSHVHIAGWHSSPDFLLRPEGPPLRDLLAQKAQSVPVRLLIWAGPPLPVFSPSRGHVAKDRIDFQRDSRIECELDKRERTMHCHHEKLVIVDDEIAFVGGIDLTHLGGNRLDGNRHPNDGRLGWHDCASVIQGPAVVDVARHFVDRWREVTGRDVADPRQSEPAGEVDLQILRTLPNSIYGFLPDGEFSILGAYLRALRAAERFIYLENQFLWSAEVVDILIDKLRNPPHPDFRLLLVLPLRPNNGKDTTRGQLGRLLGADSHNRLLATTLLGPTADSPGVYVHAKIGIIDDRWLTIGSANLNEHSLYNDTEMNVLTLDEKLARTTRLQLWSEHLDLPADQVDGDPSSVIDTVWRTQCDEQDPVSAAHQDPIHRVRRISGLSRRVDRLQGPLRGLLVDG